MSSVPSVVAGEGDMFDVSRLSPFVGCAIGGDSTMTARLLIRASDGTVQSIDVGEGLEIDCRDQRRGVDRVPHRAGSRSSQIE